MGGFGHDSYLGAGHGDGWDAQLMQRHGEQRNRHLFTGGQQHVHLSLGWIAADGVGLGGEFIGGVTHGRDHDHQIVPFLFAVGDTPGNGLDALHAADGGSAELLHQQGHPCRLMSQAIVSLCCSQQPIAERISGLGAAFEGCFHIQQAAQQVEAALG